MNVRPLASYPPPRYPTQLEVQAQPDLLAGPGSGDWYTTPVAGAVAVLLAAAGLGGCSPVRGQPLPSPTPTNGTPAVASQTALGPTAAAVVAPIFEHGEGRGATGCVVITPPVFLSEEEALQVVREELARRGLQPTRQDSLLPGVALPPEHRFDPTDAAGVPLKVDLLEPERGIAVEYVSARDHEELVGWSARSVQSYDLKELATRVAAQVRQQGHGVYFGAFYDPVAKLDLRELRSGPQPPEKGPTASIPVRPDRQALLQQSREQLRLQVTDFLDWLKAQGAI